MDWGAVIFSTTVQDKDGDGLLDVWEDEKGYIDAVSGLSVDLPNANKDVRDIFVEVDYLITLLDTNNDKHSHLPKQEALDKVGEAFAAQGINVHFDVGPNYLASCKITLPSACPDPYIIQGGTGGNVISEAALLCTDPINAPPSCQFPNKPAIGWKGGLLFVRDNASVPGSIPPIPLGNFQAGRNLSYHYLLFGHSLGAPRSLWSSLGAVAGDPTIPQLVSISNTGTQATITIKTPAPPPAPLGNP